MPVASEVTVFRSDDHDLENRRSAIELAVSTVLARMDVYPADDAPLEINIHSVQLPHTYLASFQAGPIVLDRSETHIGDGDDRFSLITCTAGAYEVVTPRGDKIPIQPGMAGLISHRLPAATIARGPNAEKTLVFPREFLNQALRNPDELVGAVPEGGMTAIRLLANYMSALLNESKPVSPQLQKTIEGHVLDLLANAYDPSGDWAHAEPNGGVQAARLQAILAYMANKFSDPGVTAELLGVEFGVSTRQVHHILKPTGRTFSEHLLEYRLQATRAALQNPRNLSKRVSEIAFDAGFKDVSYFNRSFKRRFGDTPTGYRAK